MEQLKSLVKRRARLKSNITRALAQRNRHTNRAYKTKFGRSSSSSAIVLLFTRRGKVMSIRRLTMQSTKRNT